MAIVVDDHLLLDLLADDPDDWLRAESAHSAVYTTGAWYYRLASAAHRGTGDGALSRKLTGLPESFRSDRIDTLTDRLGLIGPRVLVPVMAALTRRRPNGLMAEALAVALITSSTIVVSTDSALLRDGAEDLGIDYLVGSP